jgi:lipid A ethanolaminephosphotransferase
MLPEKQASVLAPVIVGLKVLLLLALFWAVAPAWTPVVFSKVNLFLLHQKYLVLVVYCAVFFLSILALCIAPFLENWHIRVPLVILFALSFGFDQFIVDITGAHLDTSMMRTIWAERSSEITLDAYAIDITVNLLRAVIIGLILAFPSAPWNLGNRWCLVPTSALALVVFITAYTKGATKEFPAPLAVVGNAVLAAMSTSSKAVGVKVSYNETPYPAVQHILYIIDESVRGDYIQLNNNRLSNTPFLSGLGGRLINFGVAISGANCSNASRTILSSGARQNEASDNQNASHLEPGLFQYAKRAGFRTVVIDAWKNMASYRDASERLAIDVYIPVTDDPPYVRDNRVVEKLLEILADERLTFIYVSKFGVHFPYDLSYPSQSKPKLQLAQFSLGRLLDFARIQNAAMDATKRDALVSSYSKAIEWSVDGFFQNLLPRLDLRRTLLLYTSDHGQTMWEDGYKSTHCSSSHPHPGESYVPLFALTEATPLEGRFRQGAAHGFNRASHFDIVPTLLLAMGYKEDWVSRKFSTNLFDIPRLRHRQFQIGGSAGTENWPDGAQWVTVD